MNRWSLIAVFFLAGASMAAQTVEGRVVDALTGQPIPNAQVMLLVQQGRPEYRANANDQGQYRIENVKAGTYTPRFSAPDYWPSFNPVDAGERPTVVVTSGDGSVRCDGKLQRVPKVSGRVLDGNSNPVRYARVWLIWADPSCRPPLCIGISRELKTDDAGQYSSHEFDAAGAWVIAAAAPSSWKAPEDKDGQSMGWAETYYPNVADRALAQAIEIHGGDDWRGTDIRLAAVPVHRIAGKVVDAAGDPVPKATVTLTRDNGPAFDAETESNGAFAFDAVADGDWTLVAHFGPEATRLIGMRDLRLNGDAKDFEIELSAPFAIHGRVTVERAEGIPGLEIPDIFWTRDTQHVRIEAYPPIRPLAVDEKGEFTVANVYPGPYRISVVAAPPPPYYLDSIQVGGIDAAESVQILSSAQTVEIRFRSDGGRVTGTAEGCGAVALIPVAPAHRLPGFLRGAPCGSDGRFDIAAVRPGAYYAVALAAGPRGFGSLIDDEVRLQNDGVAVTVRRNEAISVDLKVK